MNNMDYSFPQYLSAPVQVLWYEADEFMVFCCCFMAAMVFGGWLLYISVIAAPWFYIKVKAKYPNGYLKHMLYISGLKDLKGYPISFEVEFLE